MLSRVKPLSTTVRALTRLVTLQFIRTTHSHLPTSKWCRTSAWDYLIATTHSTRLIRELVLKKSRRLLRSERAKCQTMPTNRWTRLATTKGHLAVERIKDRSIPRLKLEELMSLRKEESLTLGFQPRSWLIGILEAMFKWEDRHKEISTSLWDSHRTRSTKELAKFSRIKVSEDQETPILCNLTTKTCILDPLILEVLAVKISLQHLITLIQTALKEVKTS